MMTDKRKSDRAPARLRVVAILALLPAPICAAEAAAHLAGPHLEVTGTALSVASPMAGQSLVVTATIANTGTAATPQGTAIPVRFRLDSAPLGRIPGSIPPLAPGATATVQATWMATAGAHTLTVVTDPHETVPGLNLAGAIRHQPFFVQATGPAPHLYLPSSAVAPNGGSATLGVAVPAVAGDSLSVALTADRHCPSGSSLALVSATLVYTPCAVSTETAGLNAISYLVTDTTNGLSIPGTYLVHLATDNTTAAHNPTVTYNMTAPMPNWSPALAAVMAGTPGARARILTLGDSTTQGHGDELDAASFEQGQGRSYPELLANDLAHLGFPSVHNSAYDASNTLNALITFVGNTVLNPAGGAGGSPTLTQSAGDGFDYHTTLFAAFDHVDVLFTDGGGQFSVSVDGGAVQCSHAETASAMTKNYSCAVPAGKHAVVSIRQIGSAGTFFQGLAVWNSVSPKIELLNVGIGGAFSASLAFTYPAPLYNYGQMEAAYALQPQMALINFGTNDLANNTTLNQTGNNTTVQQMALNYQQAIVSLRQAGIDPVIVIAQPFASGNYATLMPQWRAAAIQLAYAANVLLIDLSATFENDFYALPHLDNLHPNEQGYADMSKAYTRALTQSFP